MPSSRHLRMTTASISVAALLISGAWVLGQTSAPGPQSQTKPKAKSKKHVDPDINKQFRKADVKEFIKRFESESREVYARRKEITDSLGLKPGMAIADIGAGTGLFTRLFAERVGPKGKVFAVDISKGFLNHIAADAKARGESQVVTVLGSQDSTNLPPESIDLAFFCDVYHHLESHEKVLETVHRALRPGGELILIEFDRVEGKSSDFVLKHVRASQSEFSSEIEAAGFERLSGFRGPKLRENFMARFRRKDRADHRPSEGRGKREDAVRS